MNKKLILIAKCKQMSCNFMLLFIITQFGEFHICYQNGSFADKLHLLQLLIINNNNNNIYFFNKEYPMLQSR